MLATATEGVATAATILGFAASTLRLASLALSSFHTPSSAWTKGTPAKSLRSFQEEGISRALLRFQSP